MTTRRFDRRRALMRFGAAGLGAVLAACGKDGTPTTTTGAPPTPGAGRETEPQGSAGPSVSELLEDANACTVTAAQAEGPFYFDVGSIRSDIREDRDGAELRLAFRVREAGSCRPLPDAVVDIWHCDALGVYSGFDAGRGKRFLRGAQVTDRDGIAQFTTLYPGAYGGRTVHVHAKVHLDRHTALTTQVYFPQDATERVHAQPPYELGRGRTNDDDALFDASLLLTLRRQRDGYLGAINFDVQRA